MACKGTGSVDGRVISVSMGDWVCKFTASENIGMGRLTINERTAISRRPSIQNAHEAIHRLPSDAASGRTLSSKIPFKTGPSSPSYARVIAIASWRSPIWFKQTWAASRIWSARRKNEAAYSSYRLETAQAKPFGRQVTNQISVFQVRHMRF